MFSFFDLAYSLKSSTYIKISNTRFKIPPGTMISLILPNAYGRNILIYTNVYRVIRTVTLKHFLGWCCGLEGQAATCSASIPCGYQFEFYFWSSSLLMAGRAVEPLHPCGQPGRVPGFWFQVSPTLVTAAIWGENQSMEYLSLSLILSLFLSFSHQIKINL